MTPPSQSSTALLSVREYFLTFSSTKEDLVKPLHKAAYAAALGLSDEEVKAVVRDALVRARRDLSS